MRILFSFFLFLLAPFIAFSQLNMTLQDSVTYKVGVNDINGWVAPDGKEYALVGLHTGVAIVDINEDTLKEVAFVAGVNNLWRDINTYGHYAYVSSEAYVGLLIIDLQYLPDSVQTFIWRDSLPTPNGPKPFEKAHTLWTDEDGLLFLNGSNLNNGGVIMLDIATNPIDPIFLGYAPSIYSHDCYSRDSIIYSAEIYDGNLSMYDAHDPQNITLIGRVKTPHEFTHNAWLSDNSQYMFTTDERPNSYVTSYDISDPSNIVELDRYRQAATDGRGNVGHNVYVWNDWLVVAYYANGTVIVDASRPDNLVEVGNFDTYLGDGGFPGVWGSYPWLPSGKILSSDRNSGLYVFIPNYVHACFLEGTVVDSITDVPLNNAVVTIVSDEVVFPQSTKPNGEFKMGKAVPGLFNITATKDGYFPKTFSAQFVNGEILTPVIELVPIPTYVVTGKVLTYDNLDAPFAKVSLAGPDGVYETTSDENGNFIMPALFEGSYELQAGIWGQTYETTLDLFQPEALTIHLIQGYYDDFDLDLGWTVGGQVSSGAWTRGNPVNQLFVPDNYVCSPEDDSPNDIGSLAYSTGLDNTQFVQEDEVSGGTTWLVSPPMDLTQASNPKISFDYWLCEYSPNPQEGLKVWVTNGIDTVFLDLLSNGNVEGSWHSKEYSNLSLQGPFDQVRFLMSASDTTDGIEQNYYVLKVLLDRFKVTYSSLSTGDKLTTGKYFTIYPNPVTGSTMYMSPQIKLDGDVVSVKILDVHGRLLSTHAIEAGQKQIVINHSLLNGMYYIQWFTDKGEAGVEKVSVIGNQ